MTSNKTLVFSATVTALLLSSQLSLAYDMPAATAMALAGANFSTWGDVLQPLQQSNQRLIYTDFQAQGSSTHAGILSLGAGIRQLVHKQAIVGAYLFADRARSSDHEYYNVLGPGAEYLTPTWRLRANGYIPIGNDKHLIDSGWADDYGNYSYVGFEGHEVWDKQAWRYETLSYGGDISLGYRFAQDDRWEVEVRPYAFDADYTDTIIGGKAEVTFYNNHYSSIVVGDGYDNVNHNRVYAGISFSFGARSNNNSMDDLMLSPVYRNLDVNTTDSGIANSEYIEYSTESSIEDADAYFIDPDAEGSSGNGTVENPYTSMDQINEADDPDAHFRVESDTGGYYYTSSDVLELSNNQTLGGYTDNYTTPATGDDRPIINTPGLLIAGESTVENIILEQSSGTSLAAQDNALNSSSNDAFIRIEDDASGTFNNVSTIADNAAFVLNNGATLTLNNGSTVLVDSDDAEVGIVLGDDANLTISGGSTLTINSVDQELSTGIDMASATGSSITVEEGAIVTVTSSTGEIYGINGDGSKDSTITVDASTVDVSTTGNSNVMGVVSRNNTNNRIDILNGSSILSEGVGGEALGLRIESGSNVEVSLIDSTVVCISEAGTNAMNIASGTIALYIENSTIYATTTGSGGHAIAIRTTGNSLTPVITNTTTYVSNNGDLTTTVYP